MPLDHECLNLDIIGTQPIEKDNLKHWQQSAALARLGFNSWKNAGCKKVRIGNTVYKLEKLYVRTSKTK